MVRSSLWNGFESMREVHSREEIEALLIRLGRKMALVDHSPLSLLVVGGADLILQHGISRTTRDVDVVAVLDQGEITRNPLPEGFCHLVTETARDLNAQSDWVNHQAMPLLDLPLPEGIQLRAKRVDYGPCLTICFASRQDLISLKLYAACEGQKGRRHVQDLIALDATTSEISEALKWIRVIGNDALYSRAKAISEGLKS